ncbi:MAG TPA: membrane dipeptidase [Firmicutes bacterium]|nr:membrane dipeptidase [Candidatus Fermentithermobacillaceae bacterium]
MDLKSALSLNKKKEETAEDRELLLERAQEIHAESIVVDGHVGTLFDVLLKSREFGERSEKGHVDLPRLKEGGVKCVVLSAFPFDRTYPIRGVKTGLEYVDAFRTLSTLPGVVLAENASQVEAAAKEGNVAAILSFEGGEFLDGSIESLRMFHRLGLRLLGLTWNERNALADGAAESGTRGGLTRFGRAVVRECADLGIIVDVSHISEAGFWDVVEMTEQPVVASHSNCHKLYAHPRNLTDDQIRAIAETGGVVAVSFNPDYMGDEEAEVTLGTVCDHIMHVMEVGGEEAVAIGSDFDSFRGREPEPLTSVDRLPLLTEELLRRGVPGKTISLILGGNWLRVMRAVLG